MREEDMYLSCMQLRLLSCPYMFFFLDFHFCLGRALTDYRKLWNQLGRLCYGRAYLDFNPERFVSCSSPLIELVPVVETQLVIIWSQGSPMVL